MLGIRVENRHRQILISVLTVVALTLPAMVYAHGGGLDSLGCHHNRKLGGYHCHRGSLAGQSFESKSEALKVLRARESGQSSQQSQTKRPSTQVETESQVEREERIVYVTRTGKKYHGPNCRYLSQSKIPISVKDAKERGFTACSVCRGR